MVTEISGVSVDPSTGGHVLSLSDALSSPENGWPLRPFQIVSLYEVLKRYAEAFYHVGEILSRIKTATLFYEITTPQKPVDETTRKDFIKQLGIAEAWCQAIGLEVSVKGVKRAIKRLETPELKRKDVHLIFGELMRRVQDEIGSAQLLYVPSNAAGFYQTPLKGWEQIADRFPHATRDIEEAWKCFALSRYTAAVFHSLLVVEVGLIELGTFIQVSDPFSGWTAVAQRLKKIIDTKYQDLSEFEKANRAFLEQLQGTVEALKNAWRNKISHAQGKLTVMTGEEFHPDVAEEILSATRAFMRRLAEGLPPKSA
jgi:hypothetical protein